MWVTAGAAYAGLIAEVKVAMRVRAAVAMNLVMSSFCVYKERAKAIDHVAKSSCSHAV